MAIIYLSIFFRATEEAVQEILRSVAGRRANTQYYQSRKGLNFFLLTSHLRSTTATPIPPLTGQESEEIMVLDNVVLSSPHRKSPSFRRQFQRDELGSWSTLFHRHRFLFTALVLLTFLCTIYLYFAVTLGSTMVSCSGLSGSRKAQCQFETVKSSMKKGKLKFL